MSCSKLSAGRNLLKVHPAGLHRPAVPDNKSDDSTVEPDKQCLADDWGFSFVCVLLASGSISAVFLFGTIVFMKIYYYGGQGLT